jgi:hypothetical protein
MANGDDTTTEKPKPEALPSLPPSILPPGTVPSGTPPPPMFGPGVPTTTAVPFAGAPFPEPSRQDLIARQQMATEQAIAESQAAQERIRALGAQRDALPGIRATPEPRFGNITRPPQQKFQEPFKAFANPLVLATVLGSLAVRRGGGLAAMQAATKAMEGFHKGDQEAMKQEMDNWHEATDAVIKQNNIELGRYNAALNTTKHNVGERAAKMEAIAASVGDEVKLAAMRQGDWDRVISLTDQQRQWTEKMEEAKLKYGAGAMTDGDVQSAAKRLAAGESQQSVERSFPTSGVVGAENKNRVNRAAEELYRAKWGDNWPDEIQKQRARVAAQTYAQRGVAQRAANQEFIGTQLAKSIPGLVNAAAAVKPGNWRPLNELIQMADESISDPALKTFKIKMLQTAELWARSMNPTGVMRVADRDKAIEHLGTIDGIPALLAGLQAVADFVKVERDAADAIAQGKPDLEIIDVAAEYAKATGGDTTGAGGKTPGIIWYGKVAR